MHGLRAGYRPNSRYEEVAVISVLAPSNIESEDVQQALEHMWEAHAPHHLAWYDSAAAGQDKVVGRAQDLSAVPSVSSFAPSQVIAGWIGTAGVCTGLESKQLRGLLR